MQFQTHNCDVVIVGGGGAAALAAVAARQAGATVAMITKESSLAGGATIVAAGGTSATLTAGDHAQMFLGDILNARGNLNNRILVSTIAERSAQALFDLACSDYAGKKMRPRALV